MSEAGSNDVPSWLYFLGVVSILFVIYVWQAPLEWFSDFLTDWFTSGVPSSPTPAPTE